MLQAKSGRSDEQQQEQNSPNLLAEPCKWAVWLSKLAGTKWAPNAFGTGLRLPKRRLPYKRSEGPLKVQCRIKSTGPFPFNICFLSSIPSSMNEIRSTTLLSPRRCHAVVVRFVILTTAMNNSLSNYHRRHVPACNIAVVICCYDIVMNVNMSEFFRKILTLLLHPRFDQVVSCRFSRKPLYPLTHL